MIETKLMTLDPAHFHAALVQKEMCPGLAREACVYAPLGPDLIAHLQRIVGFNSRPSNPTAWQLQVCAGPDYFERMLAERPGNVVVLAGRNRRKIDYLQAAVAAGLHVLADKPWIIDGNDLDKVEAVLDLADSRGLVAYDIMTERHEITSILQRELVQDREVFGTLREGTDREPAVFMESVHFLRKQVAGSPLRRPPSFFDVAEQGEGLSDVGTHLVDLVPWILFPALPIDYRRDIQLLSARRWPTELSRSQFAEVTGENDFPPSLAGAIDHNRLLYFCNNFVSYRIRGVHVQLNVLWEYESPQGSDTHLAVVRGSRSRIEVRQGAAENFRPELYVVPHDPADKPGVRQSLERKVADLQGMYRGLAVAEQGNELIVRIPDEYRIGHEAHFGEVTRQFLHYLEDRRMLPAWEKPNMLAKYFVTTRGVDLARR